MYAFTCSLYFSYYLFTLISYDYLYTKTYDVPSGQ